MAEFQAYKMEMVSALHVGERGVGMENAEETFHSDSLFSALCVTIGQIRGTATLEEWLAAFLGPKPPLLISSTFPYYGDLLLLPRPRLKLRGRHFDATAAPGDAGTKLARRTKDVVFVSWAVFVCMVARQSLDVHLDGSSLLMGDRVWLTPGERARLPKEVEQLWHAGDPVPRVTVDRISSRSAIFHVGRVSFQPGGGLYFLVKWNDERWKPLLAEALEHLGHAGIGGERSAGHGQFKTIGPIHLGLAYPDDSSQLTTLSLYHPRQDEVARGVLARASYDLVTRRGWIDSPQTRAMRRKTVRMLREGSVVGATATGDIVDVTPDDFDGHRVYRYGLAFPVNVEEENDGD